MQNFRVELSPAETPEPDILDPIVDQVKLHYEGHKITIEVIDGKFRITRNDGPNVTIMPCSGNQVYLI